MSESILPEIRITDLWPLAAVAASFILLSIVGARERKKQLDAETAKIRGTLRDFAALPLDIGMSRDHARLQAEQASLVARAFDVTWPTVETRGSSLSTATIFIRIDGQSSSIKPGNITLNWSHILPMSAAALTASDLEHGRWILDTLIALGILKEVKEAATEQLTEREACLILALWNCGGGRGQHVNEERLLVATNEELQRLSEKPIDKVQLSRSVNRLTALDCIRMECGAIELNERVVVVRD